MLTNIYVQMNLSNYNERKKNNAYQFLFITENGNPGVETSGYKVLVNLRNERFINRCLVINNAGFINGFLLLFYQMH